MKAFELKLNTVLESVIDPPKDELDQSVWNGTDLKPEIKSILLKHGKILNNISTVSRIILIGGITTYNYSASSDIDVNAEVPNATDEEMNLLRNKVQEINGSEEIGGHYINWWVTQKLDSTRYDSIYDVLRGKWLKGPRKIYVNIADYLGQFEEIVQKIDLSRIKLAHDVINIDMIKNSSSGDINKAKGILRSKLTEIESEISKIKKFYNHLINARRDAFADPDPIQLQEYKMKSLLPENIIYLLLRKYYYVNFMMAINDINNVSVNKLGEINKAIKEI